MSSFVGSIGVTTDREIIAGDGLTGGGDLTANRTIDVVANPDGSIDVNTDNIGIGILANDSQHGNLGGGNLHSAATLGSSGFMSTIDKANSPSAGEKAALAGTFGSPSTINKYLTETDPSLDAYNIVTVAPIGADFTSVKAAIESISDATEQNPYIIDVYPAVYYEDPFSMKPYVTVTCPGTRGFAACLRTNSNNAHFITGAASSSFLNIDVRGPTGVGYAAFNFTSNSSLPFRVDNVIIEAGYYGVWCHPTIFSLCLLNSVSIRYTGSIINTFIYVTDHGFVGANFSAVAESISKACLYGYKASGSNSNLSLFSCSYSVPDGYDAVYADNGAIVKIQACNFTEGVNGIHIGSTGTGTYIDAFSTLCADTLDGYELIIDTPNCRVGFNGGELHSTRISIPAGTTFAGSFADDSLTGGEGIVNIGELWLGTTADTAVPLATYTRAHASSGLAVGGEIDRVSGLNISIAEGYGFINITTGVLKVSWNSQVFSVTPNKSNSWIVVNSSGIIEESFGQPNETSRITLGVVSTNVNSILFIASYSALLSQPVPGSTIYARDVIGPISVSGCGATKHDLVSLEIDVDSGSYYISNNLKNADAYSLITFTYWYRNSSGVWITLPEQTSINPDGYDAYNYIGSGTIQPVPAGLFKRDLLYLTTFNHTAEFHVVYGQQVFATALLAISNPNPPTIFDDVALRVAGIVTQESVNDITIIDQRPRLGQLSSAGTAVTAHGQLTGLSHDDHLQYQLRTEKGAISGYCGLNASSKVDTVNLPITVTPPVNVTKSAADDGISNELARQDHKHDISTAAPVATAVVIDGVADDGIATTLARSDHIHTVTAGSPVTIGTANADGAATTFARSNHVHDHGSQTSGTLHAAVIASSTSGFMTGADKTRLDGMANNAAALTALAPANVTKATADVGAGTTAAKSDHKHDISTATPSAIGTSNIEGDATSLARSNHIHDHGSQTSGTLHAAVIASSTSGFMTGADKTRLDGMANNAAALTSDAPANVTKDTANAGLGTTAAKSDHKHDITTATPSSIGTSNVEGAATSLARSNHIHDHGAQTSGTLHAAVIAGSTSGFMTGADKTKLDGLITRSAMLMWGNSGISTTTTTRYLNPSYADATAGTTSISFRMPYACTLRKFYLRQNNGAGNGNAIVYTLYVNGVASTLTVSIASTANDASDLVHTVSVAQGALLSIVVTKAASIGTTPTDIIATIEAY